jgi:hypothetical protein
MRANTRVDVISFLFASSFQSRAAVFWPHCRRRCHVRTPWMMGEITWRVPVFYFCRPSLLALIYAVKISSTKVRFPPHETATSCSSRRESNLEPTYMRFRLLSSSSSLFLPKSRQRGWRLAGLLAKMGRRYIKHQSTIFPRSAQTAATFRRRPLQVPTSCCARNSAPQP